MATSGSERQEQEVVERRGTALAPLPEASSDTVASKRGTFAEISLVALYSRWISRSV
jgi:hypothetical protein